MTRRADSIPTQAEDWHKNVDRLLWHNEPEDVNACESRPEKGQLVCDESEGDTSLSDALPASGALPLCSAFVSEACGNDELNLSEATSSIERVDLVYSLTSLLQCEPASLTRAKCLNHPSMLLKRPLEKRQSF